MWVPTESNNSGVDYRSAEDFNEEEIGTAAFNELWKKGDLATYPMCLYHCLVTLTTLGYGRITARSVTGKVCAGIIAISGIIASSLLTSIIINKTTPTEYDQYLKHWLLKRDTYQGVRQYAAKIIQLAWRYKRRRRVITKEVMTKVDEHDVSKRQQHFNSSMKLLNENKRGKIKNDLNRALLEYKKK